MSDGMYCRICNRLMIPSKEQICSECKEALRQAGYVKAVRCKDCKYRNENKTCGREKQVVDWYVVNDDWFCANWEPK